MDPDPEPLFLFLSFDFLTALNLCALIVLLISSALISGTEVAFFSLSQTDLDELSNEEKKENIVVKLLEKPRKLLATILITNNFINILIVLLFASLAETLFGDFNYQLNFNHPSIILKVDTIQLTQVIFNLILNAVYFSPENGNITIDVIKNSKDVELRISDEGPGIKNNITDKIFEPFFTTEHSGTGLGLYLCREICEANNAHIKYIPNDHLADITGTCFCISFAKVST